MLFPILQKFQQSAVFLFGQLVLRHAENLLRAGAGKGMIVGRDHPVVGTRIARFNLNRPGCVFPDAGQILQRKECMQEIPYQLHVHRGFPWPEATALNQSFRKTGPGTG